MYKIYLLRVVVVVVVIAEEQFVSFRPQNVQFHHCLFAIHTNTKVELGLEVIH